MIEFVYGMFSAVIALVVLAYVGGTSDDDRSVFWMGLFLFIIVFLLGYSAESLL